MDKKSSNQGKCNMLPKHPHSFAKGVEGLVDPIDVGTIHFVQQLNGMLPKAIQKKLMDSSSKKIPFMGFVVEPYSSFLCYEITNIKAAEALLPCDFKLIKTKVFADEEPAYYCIFGSFRAHTSAFWGARTEFYIIAEDTRTGLLTWVIIDYDTNTISHDNARGLISPTSRSTITINHRGELFVDIENLKNPRHLEYSFNVEGGKMKAIDQRLWLEGNLSVGYGKELGDGDNSVFSLKFEPCEVEKALEIDPDEVYIEHNNWYPEIVSGKPKRVVCFPYSQHFISDSPGYSSKLKNEQELMDAIKAIDFDNIKVFSTKSLKTMFMISSAVSALVTLTLLILYLIK